MLPTPLDLNREHLELLYRALGRGLVVYQYVEGTLYLLRSLLPKSAGGVRQAVLWSTWNGQQTTFGRPKVEGQAQFYRV